MILSDIDKAILFDVLGRTDALFTSFRVYSNPASCLSSSALAATYERRSLFKAKGVPIVGGGSVADRKAFERQLNALGRSGLLVLSRSGARGIHGKLTPRGDDVVRYLVISPMLHEGWHYLAKISELVVNEICHNRFVTENDLARCDYGEPSTTKALNDLEMELLPLKAAGLVDDDCDSQGRVWHAITASGLEAAKGPAPAPPEDLPEYVEGAWEHPLELEKQYRAERERWEPETPSHVGVPMSCGFRPRKTWRDLPTAPAPSPKPQTPTKKPRRKQSRGKNKKR